MAIDHYEQLRRDAQERGMRDYEREAENARISGEPIFRNNPYQNNHATDEREFWAIGWENARKLAEQDREFDRQKAAMAEWREVPWVGTDHRN